jgi:hypothetical protein
VTPTSTLSLDGVLTEMRDGSLAHRSILIRLTLLLALASALLSPAQGSGAFGQAIGFGFSIFIGVVYAGMVILVLCVETEDGSVAGLWRALSPILAKLVWVSLIVAVGVGAGLLLLIVPGLILLTLWIVAPAVAVVEKPGIFASLDRSRELVRGNGLRVFLFLLLLGMMIFFAATLGALLAMPFGSGLIGSAVATFIVSAAINPLTAIGPATLYNCLSSDPTEPLEPDPTEPLDPGDPAEPSEQQPGDPDEPSEQQPGDPAEPSESGDRAKTGPQGG